MADNTGISVPALTGFAAAVLERVGVPAADASRAAEALVASDLRAVDTHGVRLLPIYVERLRGGGVNPRPALRLVSEGPSVALLDGDQGLGQVACSRAMAVAIEKAAETGIGMAAVKNSSHCGAAAYYAMMALGRDMIGICLSNTLASMVAWGSASRAIGNNVVGFAVPAGERAPVVLDMTTSMVSWNKIRVAAERGEKIPWDWALDTEGHRTDEPQRALDGGPALPIGGAKGSGLAIVIDLLTGVLSGGAFGQAVRPLFENPALPELPAQSVIAIDVGRFLPIATFKTSVDAFTDELKRSPRMEGFAEILMPGERAHREQQRRDQQGIPLGQDVVEKLSALARELDIDAHCLG